MTPHDTCATSAALQRYLRTLWGIGPPVLLAADGAPALVQGRVRLPSRPPDAFIDPWRWHCAAAAHAGAHLVFSPPAFDGRGLRPIVRALLGVIEDARVEALAGRELPGLHRLWAGLHTAAPADGESVPALLGRLSRALADRRYADPHPWIAKGRAIFHADAGGEVLALGNPALLREAASRLGHDLGQMRLQFDARSWRPVPGYRDDNAWMWPAEMVQEPAPAPAVGRDDAAARPTPRTDGEPVARLPEWDRLIGRMRPDWVLVYEDEADDGAPAAPLEPAPRALRAAVRAAAARRLVGGGRRLPVEAGERPDPDALVRARVAQRMHLNVDPRIYRHVSRVPARGCSVVLLDRSLSGGDRLPGADTTVLGLSARSAVLLVEALESRGTATALYGFASEGRGALRMTRLKRSAEVLDGPLLRRRLGMVRPGGSTRLGAALRRALQTLRHDVARGPLSVVLVGDLQPHDVDVHDPRYLGEDLRQALHEARRQGVCVRGLVIGDRDGHAPLALGAGASVRLSGLAELPRALERLGL